MFALSSMMIVLAVWLLLIGYLFSNRHASLALVAAAQDSPASYLSVPFTNKKNASLELRSSSSFYRQALSNGDITQLINHLWEVQHEVTPVRP